MHLFDRFTLRGVTFRNRIGVSPMCEYSSADGFANDWHLVHLGSRAVGGAGLVFTEAAAVEERGRISPDDLGIWKDDHIEQLARITTFLKAQGAVAGIQLAHAGRKAGTHRPWEGGGPIPLGEGGWLPIAPGAIPFDTEYTTPAALTRDDIADVITAFAAAARRSLTAGFQTIEIHAAHGYLLHQFLSPLSNPRTDEYGGSFENRTRIVREVTEAIRREWPDTLPLFLRISATDWAEGGWDIEQSVELARQVKPLGVDVVDCSSGGAIPRVKIPVAPGYQVPFAERIRREAGIATAAVGLITTPAEAETIVRDNQADIVLLGRELLRDDYWPYHAAKALGAEGGFTPPQYERAW